MKSYTGETSRQNLCFTSYLHVSSVQQIYLYVVRWKRGDKCTCMICTFHATCNMDTKMMSQLFQLKICSTITKLQTSWIWSRSSGLFPLKGRAMYKFLIRKLLNSEKKPNKFNESFGCPWSQWHLLKGLTIIMSQ